MKAQPDQASHIAVQKRRSFLAWLLVLLLGYTLVLLPSGVINQGDGGDRYLQTKAILNHGRWSIDPADFPTPATVPATLVVGSGGRYYSKYAPGLSIVWLIPAGAAKLLHRLIHVDTDVIAGALISVVNPVITVMTALSLVIIGGRLGFARRVGVSVALLYLLGTSALPYANTAFSEPLCNLMLLWAFALPLYDGSLRAVAVSALLAGLLILMKNELAIACGAVFLAVCGGRRDLRAAMLFASIAAIGILATLVLNQVQRGGVFHFSYGNEASQFHSPWAGLHGYFLGIDKNILFFNPALLVALPAWFYVRRLGARWRWAFVGVASVWAFYVIFYASWWAWNGGLCFGPRFFQQFTGATLLALLPLVAHLFETIKARQRFWGMVVLIACCAVGTLANLPGIMVKSEEPVVIAQDSAVGGGEWWTHYQVLWLKLSRGIRHPEVYQASDFRAGAPPREFDFRAKRTFQFLNHWWSIYLANRMRHTQAPRGAPMSTQPAARIDSDEI